MACCSYMLEAEDALRKAWDVTVKRLQVVTFYAIPMRGLGNPEVGRIESRIVEISSAAWAASL